MNTLEKPRYTLTEVSKQLDDLYGYIDQTDEEDLDKDQILSDLDPIRYHIDDHIDTIEKLMG